MAASAAATKVAFIRKILRKLGVHQDEPTDLNFNNSGAEMLAKERKVTTSSRHITQRFLKVCEYVAEDIIVVRRVATPLTTPPTCSPSLWTAWSSTSTPRS